MMIDNLHDNLKMPRAYFLLISVNFSW